MCVVCRAPWRLAVYYLQSKDERILPILQAQQHFFQGQQQIAAGYQLDGTPLVTYSNIAFQAPVWCLFKVSMCHYCAALMLLWSLHTYCEQSIHVYCEQSIHIHCEQSIPVYCDSIFMFTVNSPFNMECVTST